MIRKREIMLEARKRINNLQFGEPVTNICAGDNNPMFHCYFVEKKKGYARCTDKKGHFWDIDIEVIYPGHLDKDERKRLFDPVWEASFGNSN